MPISSNKSSGPLLSANYYFHICSGIPSALAEDMKEEEEKEIEDFVLEGRRKPRFC